MPVTPDWDDKPDNFPDWNPPEGPTTVVEPASDVKDLGYIDGEEPAAQSHNYLFKRFSQWVSSLGRSRLKIGELLGVSSAANARKARISTYLAVAGTSKRTAILDGWLVGVLVPGLTFYAYTDDSLGWVVEIVKNATWNGTQWVRSAGSTDSALARFGFDGVFRWAHRASGASSPWNDTYAGGTGWTTVATFGLTSATIKGALELLSSLQVDGVAVFQDLASFATVWVNSHIAGPAGGALHTLADLFIGDDVDVAGDAEVHGDLAVDGDTAVQHLQCDGFHATGGGVVDGGFAITGGLTAGSGLFTFQPEAFWSAFDGSGGAVIGFWAGQSSLGEAGRRLYRRRPGEAIDLTFWLDTAASADLKIEVLISASSLASLTLAAGSTHVTGTLTGATYSPADDIRLRLSVVGGGTLTGPVSVAAVPTMVE